MASNKTDVNATDGALTRLRWRFGTVFVKHSAAYRWLAELNYLMAMRAKVTAQWRASNSPPVDQKMVSAAMVKDNHTSLNIVALPQKDSWWNRCTSSAANFGEKI